MATPTLGNVPTTLDDAESTTGWSLWDTLDPDLAKEGSNAITGTFRFDGAEGYYDIVTDGGSAQNMTGRHVRLWMNFTAYAYLDTTANGGMEFFMYDGTNTAYWVAFSSDDYFGGWKNFVLDCDSTPDSGTFDKTNVRRWGCRFNRTSAPKNIDNFWVDYLRWGDGYFVTGGSTSDRIGLADILAVDRTNGYGIIETYVDAPDGPFFVYGKLTIGNGATTTWFDMVGQSIVFASAPVSSTLYGLIGVGSGCHINIDGAVLRAAGTTDATRFKLDMSDSGLLSCTLKDTLIVRANTSAFKSGQTITGNTFSDCGQITHGGATMNGSIVKGYEGTANTSALIYNVAADPDGEMDGMTFTKGTAATHAIEFGTSSPTTMTLRNCVFSGYNTANNQNDSTLHIKRTSGTVTINIIGGSGTVSYRTDGATVNIVQNPVTVTITVEDVSTGSPIQGARVFLEAADATGPYPYQESVTITSSGGTATVTHTAHGMATNDWVHIVGADQNEYNGAHQITVTGANTYTYAVSGTPASPATGTITATWVLFNATTDASGQVTDTRAYTSDQPLVGRARKSSASPYYKDASIVGTVSSTSGLSLTVQMVLDE